MGLGKSLALLNANILFYISAVNVLVLLMCHQRMSSGL